MSGEGIKRSEINERDEALETFVNTLEALEIHRALSHSDRNAIQRAFELLERGTQTSAEIAQTASFALGIRLVDALERIGYFGERGKTFEYDTRLSMALRTSISNITLDWGATLLVTVLSELRAQVGSDAEKQAKLAELIHEIEERRKGGTAMTLKAYLAALKSKVIAPALAAWLLFQEPKVGKDRDKTRS